MKAAARHFHDPVNISIPTDVSSKPGFSYRASTPQVPHLPVTRQIRQVYSYGNSSRARTPRGAATERSSGLSSHPTARAKTPAAPEPSIFVTPEIEAMVKEWLSALGMTQYFPQPRVPFYADPFRNGVLLCELTQLLEKKPLEGVIRHPANSSEVVKNFDKGLRVIAKARPPAFNPAYYSLASKMSRGNDELLWGLYWSLYNTYPAILPPHLEQVAKELPYDSVGIRRLEAALLSWMHSLGVTEEYGFPDNLIDLIPHFRSGYLLCNVVAAAFDLQFDDVFRYPKSEGGVLGNIRKALDVLKRHPTMSQKFVWRREKDIMKGNLGVVMGLMEDVCRCADGLPARKPGSNYHSDGPYCGIYEPKPVPRESVGTKSVEVLGRTPSWKKPLPPQVDGDRFGSSFPSPKNFTLGLESNMLYPAPGSGFPNDIVPSPKRKSMISFQEESVDRCEVDMPDFDGSLKRWLANIGLTQYAEGFFGGSNISEVRDGVLLCEIIEALERVKIPGVSHYPKTAAGFRQNIRRSLEFLRSKPAFPGELYYVEEDLLNGDGKTWRKLLIAIQKIYKFAVPKSRRK